MAESGTQISTSSATDSLLVRFTPRSARRALTAEPTRPRPTTRTDPNIPSLYVRRQGQYFPRGADGIGSERAHVDRSPCAEPAVHVCRAGTGDRALDARDAVADAD